jgi:hypothetical protein
LGRQIRNLGKNYVFTIFSKNKPEEFLEIVFNWVVNPWKNRKKVRQTLSGGSTIFSK